MRLWKPTCVFMLLAAAAGGCEGCEAPADGGPSPPPAPPPVTAQGKNVVVDGAGVRSCEAVFVAGGDEIPTVVFADGIVGESIPRAPRFGIAWTASGDSSLDGQEVARFSYTKDAPLARLDEVRCYDGAGAPVEGGLTLIN